MRASELLRQAHEQGVPFGHCGTFFDYDNDMTPISCCAIGGMLWALVGVDEIDNYFAQGVTDSITAKTGINLNKLYRITCECGEPTIYLMDYITHLNDQHTTDPLEIAEKLEAIGE